MMEGENGDDEGIYTTGSDEGGHLMSASRKKRAGSSSWKPLRKGPRDVETA